MDQALRGTITVDSGKPLVSAVLVSKIEHVGSRSHKEATLHLAGRSIVYMTLQYLQSTCFINLLLSVFIQVLEEVINYVDHEIDDG